MREMMLVNKAAWSGAVWRVVAAGLVLAWAGLAAGCATRDARIERNRAIFDALAPEEQTLIKDGKVAVGFTPDMVRLALGDPDQIWERTDAGGKAEAWSYTAYDRLDGVPLYRGYYHRYYGVGPYFYGDYTPARVKAREYFKVTFAAGRVVAIEQETR